MDEEIRKGTRLGLGLSGGGFRASFFHIGVLARMAELGLLRRVEVISTVSGGSVIGAYYYLRVRRLLMEKADKGITDQDYVKIVQDVEREFLAAVQKNLRMRIFLNPLKTLWMISPSYSRSDRIGELYDQYMFRPAAGSDRPVEMRRIKIRPREAAENFHPLEHNVDRSAKVPILLLNATSLNTGHSWRFEASRMGEPPGDDELLSDIDKSLRLRRPLSYDGIVPRQQDMWLGHAVAASTAVPGVFPPLSITGLYPGGIRVQLVDGGVHDNQGIQGLLDRECTHFVVSDASGQLKDAARPGTRLLGVLDRTLGVFMDRLREEQLLRLMQEHPDRVAFVHLRRGLQAEAISWIDAQGNVAGQTKPEGGPVVPSESFGVSRRVQDLLSRIRTDLDSFTEVEAQSLMADAYSMSGPEFGRTSGLKDLVHRIPGHPSWRFLDVMPWMASPTEAYLRQLEVAGRQFFKASKTIQYALFAAVLGLLLLLGRRWGLWGWLLTRITDPPSLIFFLVKAVVSAVALALLGWALVRLHLGLFDRIFLRRGRVGRLGVPPQGSE